MSSTQSTTNKQRIIICGGGVIGACIAYYLSRHPNRGESEITVIERTGVANASSGKSGGFLALDWCRGTLVDALARRSFALHAELAATLGAELNLEWGYRPIDTLSVVASEERDLRRMGRLPSPSWLGKTTAVHSRLGDVQTTAQIDPAAFTRGMMQAAEAEGVKLREGTVEGVVLADDGKRITGVQVDGEITVADAVVIAMGPWSILAAEWLALPPVYGLKGHSLVFRFEPSDPSTLFVEVEMGDGEIETPEVVPRVDGTTYICGLSGTAPLPIDPADVTLEEGAKERLRAMATAFSPALGAAEVIAEQACYRPITTDGVPLIGCVPNVEGAYVATGHSVWGMLNGPATGEAMAELILDGQTTHVDLTPFAPERLRRD